ncbi:hypothetical protein BDW02DRAFT_528478 [Decorospora gaudefroyi]|uniref:NADH-ubiquinone oxidoreductase 12 kDa subunit mitochondrial n=1 Tax=Decorospora gaudefroyi TaxID=184978 RepID=A0A6A5K9Q7_9PLEO|nr:hypothetical protein BDW02DRAFT_528478 [Decorospora gaudefroyi]
MCYYRFYIFLGCGHSTFSEIPVRFCKDADTKGEIKGLETRRSDSCSADHVSVQGAGRATAASSKSLPSTIQTVGTQTEDPHTTGTTNANNPFTRSQAPLAGDREPCGEGRVHPLHTMRVERLCAVCACEREERLAKLEASIKEVRFDPGRWHWKYQGGNQTAAKKHGGGWGVGAAVGGWMKDWNKRDGASGASRNTTTAHTNSSQLPAELRSNNLQALGAYTTVFLSPHQPLAAAMPTPESAAFLAKKPKVPPTFEGVDYEDNTALKAAQDAILREQWVKSMMARLVREEMGKCYRREGVNHLEKCGHLRERYFELLKDAKVKGYLFAQQNYLDEPFNKR